MALRPQAHHPHPACANLTHLHRSVQLQLNYLLCICPRRAIGFTAVIDAKTIYRPHNKKRYTMQNIRINTVNEKVNNKPAYSVDMSQPSSSTYWHNVLTKNRTTSLSPLSVKSFPEDSNGCCIQYCLPENYKSISPTEWDFATVGLAWLLSLLKSITERQELKNQVSWSHLHVPQISCGVE